MYLLAININERNIITTIISDDYDQNQFSSEIKLFASANDRASPPPPRTCILHIIMTV